MSVNGENQCFPKFKRMSSNVLFSSTTEEWEKNENINIQEVWKREFILYISLQLVQYLRSSNAVIMLHLLDKGHSLAYVVEKITTYYKGDIIHCLLSQRW